MSAFSGAHLYHSCRVLLGQGESAVSAGGIARSEVAGAVRLGWEPGGTGLPAQVGPWATKRRLKI